VKVNRLPWRKLLLIGAFAGYFLLGVWCCGALWFAFFQSTVWRALFLIAFAVPWLGVPWLRRRWRFGGLGAVTGAELLILLCFLSLTATNDKTWKPSFARNPHVEFNSPEPGWVTIDNIRDFHYRSVDDFDVCYRKECYDLNAVQSVDFILVHWGMDAIAHTMLSFGFSDGRRLAVSVETRVPEGTDSGLAAGIYKQYNLLMILGTERDLFALRTNFRHEDLYLYPTTTLPYEARELLADLLHQANDLERHPRFYNTLTANCTSTLAPSVRRVWSLESARSVLLNGRVDAIAYQADWLQADPGFSGDFAAFKAAHYANPRVDAFPEVPENYSELIRRPANPGSKASR